MSVLLNLSHSDRDELLGLFRQVERHLSEEPENDYYSDERKICEHHSWNERLRGLLSKIDDVRGRMSG